MEGIEAGNPWVFVMTNLWGGGERLNVHPLRGTVRAGSPVTFKQVVNKDFCEIA